MSLKSDEVDQSKNKNQESLSQKSVNSSVEPPKDYEKMVQNLESEVRNHIRVEQQLKLHIETLQFKMEEMENDSNKTKEKSKQISEVFFNYFKLYFYYRN